MGDRSELNITISFTKEGTTYARLTKIPGCGANAKATQLRTGIAQCHPDDKFNPQIGAMIAMARMFGDEVEFKSEKEAETKREAPHRMSPIEKRAKDNGYTLVRDRLPSCTAYDGGYLVMDKNGGSGGGLYWDHKEKTFTICKPDNMTDYDRICARKVWMESPDAVFAWKAQPDAVEQKALDEGYTLCRDRYPDKFGVYDVMTENGVVWHDLYWSGDHFGTCASLWMNKRDNPAIAWKEHE